eukprot:Gregarina_sp_Poly_1__721@NODE_1171_length_4869_cov_23_317784_g802_i0_p2_GENE_NODE_1171_length_4869_cov_23_317784_g802_i0NODE_1171_length_4869_cov_23_317784_g802_i0_p2_ORF_typecomplete_len535_score98_13SMC_N/PF02463_19/5_8e30AAA_21/PF13304_6/8_8e08AAA_15/PF13175_6/0_062FlaC_arch/PF05377_11/1_4FlaC_arch/PF05377_11/1_2e02FlaC_arch/PF05377_11/5_2e02FlaC_arch/PF05377_11/0_47FlaC_arch/PF05377_11/3_9e03DUF1664/PF07889_12/0_0075DUF1664/PF07889_12/5_3e02DUF1664/PF07889_12/1_1e03DUF1664/PF07889_12/2_8e02A
MRMVLNDNLNAVMNDKLRERSAAALSSRYLETCKMNGQRLGMELELLRQKMASASELILNDRRVLLSNEKETITRQDLQEMEQLDRTLDVSTEHTKTADAHLADVQRQIDNVSREINHLKLSVERLEDQLAAEPCQKTGEWSPTALQQDLVSTRSRKIQIAEHLAQLEVQVSDVSEVCAAVAKQNEELHELHDKDSRQFQRISQELDKHQSKEFDLKQRVRMHEENKSRVLSSSSFSQYDIDELKSTYSVKELQDSLRKGEKKLGDCPRVNEKAIEDLSNFRTEFDQKKREQQELQESLESVKDLMRLLDERRSQTLRMSFDMINSNLQQVFSTLVPGGRAKLVIKKLSDERVAELMQQRNEGDSQISTPGSLSQNSAYKIHVGEEEFSFPENCPLQWDDIAQGIEIKASFRPANEDVPESTHFFPIIALSGGQKTVLALSLIFAMQRCDKAPFYIFDECDAALDEGYRTSVAKLIQLSSERSQFLLTTFRRELCEVCSRHFLVTSTDRVAQVKQVTLEEAADTILVTHILSVI